MAEVKILDGEIELDYKWNPGPIIGKFLTNLRDEKEITAVRCTVSSKVFLPPLGWSPYVNKKMDKFMTLNPNPSLKLGTIVYQAPWNKPEGIEPPYMLAALSFVGADTELLHIVVAPEEKLKALKPGAKLKPVWKEKTKGTIRDIQYFIPEE
ncbi:MAG: hypothetical protein H7A25_11080 [Leptospiraceae bacterium]|nr:hypothetical protein [Leptospiraceae bacterium]MCP5500439.1 hypothetical protein [Leptospiraceae bacterium]